MNSRIRIGALLGLLLMLSMQLASAADDPLSSIVEQQSALRDDLDAGKDFGLTPRQVGIVRKAQKEVFELVAAKSSMDQLSIDEKIRLENALERINAQVKGGDRLARDEQEVCWRERKSGTTLKVTRCGTQAERDRIREDARAWMEKPSICTPPGCGN